jgi:hypothetical protein
MKFTHTAASLLFAIVAAAPVLAQTPTSDEFLTGTKGSVDFATGGIGEEQQKAVKALAPNYNVLITFANKNGEYRANIGATVLDKNGDVAFDIDGAGPLLYLKLPQGTYRINVRSDAGNQTKNISVPPLGKREVGFTW